MSKSIEHLLTPRYKVIAHYPKSSYFVDEVVGEPFNELYERYPNIFRKMEWWEERTLEEMPDYVKGVRSNNIYKVLGVSDNVTELKVESSHKQYEWAYIICFTPATKEEYDNQFKEK